MKVAAALCVVFCLIGAGIAFLAQATSAHEQPKPTAQAQPQADAKKEPVQPAESPTPEYLKPLDIYNRIEVRFSEQQRFGITCPKLADPRNPQKPKLLTRDERGITNNTCVRIEGYEYLYGVEIPGVRYVKENGKIMKEVPIAGRPRDYDSFVKKQPKASAEQIAAWISDLDSNEFAVRTKATDELRKHVLQAAPDLEKALNGKPSLEVRQRIEDLLAERDRLVVKDFAWQSVWESEFGRIRITQSVEIILGEQTRLYDTALVKYHIWNRDRTPHTVGLRIMLDSFIGTNDGLPFYIAPTNDKPARFVDKLEIFAQKDIPEFVQTLETNDLKDLNAALVMLCPKIKGCEPVEKMVICRWPQNSEARWGGGAGPGEWKYEAIDQNPNAKDSCLVLYWAQANMKPDEKRELGFIYGLGRILGDPTTKDTVVAGDGKLRLFVGNRATSEKPFVAVAYVKSIDPNQKVTLKLPEGLTLADGHQEEQSVPAANREGYAQVTWRVKASKTGNFTLEADAPGIGTAKEAVQVRETSLFE